MAGLSIRIRGIVQGVGFRPFVWLLAHECSLVGSVLNDAEGVLVQVWGRDVDLVSFQNLLKSTTPPLAVIDSVESSLLQGTFPGAGFSIIESTAGETQTGISPDASTCPDCLADTLNPDDRLYRYPFTNCTHCGPRFSIIRSVPYDRAKTSMVDYTMCEDCQAEYDDPADRRFHAQPNACPVCGPRVWLEDRDGNEIEPATGQDAIACTARLIDEGKIVAIKGIGGFHLACDATQSKPVASLRMRKKRYAKPFALMAPDVNSVKKYARLSEDDERLLQDHAAPIVILDGEGEGIAPGVAPGQTSLGFMLPYTPLHHILMQELKRPIVMTSGNQSNEPQCFDNDAARKHLSGIADCFLVHDRVIVNRIDDSILRTMAGSPRFLRRARGYTPEPLVLPKGFEGAADILAMGSELKNTFCLLKNGRAVVSRHMGNLEEMTVMKDYLSNHALYENLFDHQPQAIAIDRHPGYLSSQTGKQWAQKQALPLIEVQHHHAHVASCMVEHALPANCADVLGIVLDGLGMGEDDTIWGGEFMQVGYAGFKRLARFQPTPMIGGVQAILEPWRSAYSHLRHSLNWDEVSEKYGSLDIIKNLRQRPLTTFDTMIAKGINSPMASSCGRLFDAAAAMLSFCPEGISYEGEAAILMEALCTSHFENEKNNAYPFAMSDQDNEMPELVWGQFWKCLLDDLMAGTDRAIVAARFHQGIVYAVSTLGEQLARQYGLNTVVLSGGVFQNRLVLEGVTQAISKTGLNVLSPRLFPTNDGGLSLGQAAIAAIKYRN
jgi:hydrogenase maturation protein HypF